MRAEHAIMAAAVKNGASSPRRQQSSPTVEVDPYDDTEAPPMCELHRFRIEQAIKEAPSPGGFAGFREKFKFPALNLKCFGTRTDSCVKR